MIFPWISKPHVSTDVHLPLIAKLDTRDSRCGIKRNQTCVIGGQENSAGSSLDLWNPGQPRSKLPDKSDHLRKGSKSRA